MKKKNLWFISALMIVSVLGVLLMQLYYINEAYNLKKQLFEQNVDDALNSIANRVQKRVVISKYKTLGLKANKAETSDLRKKTEQIIAYKEAFKAKEALRKRRQIEKSFAYLYYQDSVIRKTFASPRLITEEEYRLISTNSLTNNDLNPNVYGSTSTSRRIALNIRKQKLEMMEGKLPDTLRYLALEFTTGQPRMISLPVRDQDLVRQFRAEDATEQKKYLDGLNALFADTAVFSKQNHDLIADVAKEIQLANEPLNRRISKETLNTLIQTELHNRNIYTPYFFWLSLVKKDSIIFSTKPGTLNLSAGKTYRTILFNVDTAKDPGVLSINFPNRSTAIISTMGFNLLSSLVILVILIGVFVYTMYAIITQKKITEMKNDFINNMTHEFKTPVATIMLASEALKDPDIETQKSRVVKLANIIYDENMRLSNHIERVLNVARIEKKKINFVLKPNNINEIIRQVTQSMSLQLQNKEATLVLNLNATKADVLSDELHMSNVMYNLIDNAIKYSSQAPKITINTFNKGHYLVIEVIDEGIGMRSAQVKHIFDQFYRVSTGNIHDVKGFGLGLSYVQEIVSQMNGKIKVHSEKDKGSTFEIFLPTNN